jgi:hypothetical protein
MSMPQKKYTIPKGKLLFKMEGQSNFADLGNCTDFKFTVKTTEEKHFSSRSGFNTKDDSAITEQTAAGSFTLDDMMDENLKMFLLASAINSEVQASGSATDQAVTAELDKWIELGKMKLSAVVVTSQTPAAWQTAHEYSLGDFVLAGAYRAECTTAGTSSTPEPTWGTTVGAVIDDGATLKWTIRKITYTLNTDYLIDTEVGHLMPLSDGAIAAAQALLVDYSYAAITTKRIDAATAKTLKGHIYMIGDPPKGVIRDVKGYVSLLPGGDLSVIGTTWQNMQFNMEFETNSAYAGLYWTRTRGTVVSE